MEGKNNKNKVSTAESNQLFDKLKNARDERVKIQDLRNLLDKNGINDQDPRLGNLHEFFKIKNTEDEIDQARFFQIIEGTDTALWRKMIHQRLAIPNFQDFKEDIEELFEATQHNTEGEPDETVPHPKAQNPPAFAVSVCTVDGQLLQLGEHNLDFVIQSICKPINYAIAVEEAGKEKVHQHVGAEPGSESFESSMMLNENDLPHNPMITSGAIMTSCFIKPKEEMEERLQHVIDVWEKMMGNKKVHYNEESFNREIKDSDKHFALAHLMKQHQAFPEGVDVETAIRFYLKCCAIAVNIDDLAHAGATLANYGSCPSTGRKIFQHDTVRDTLSLMLSSGMYDHSGEFAFRVGMPAKSGIAGGLLIVVPGLMGISVYSPPLDEKMNSVRGVEFCERLADKFNFHIYDSDNEELHGKKDPRKNTS